MKFIARADVSGRCLPLTLRETVSNHFHPVIRNQHSERASEFHRFFIPIDPSFPLCLMSMQMSFRFVVVVVVVLQ